MCRKKKFTVKISFLEKFSGVSFGTIFYLKNNCFCGFLKSISLEQFAESIKSIKI